MNIPRSELLAKAWTPLLFSLVLIIGMILGFNLRDTLRSKRDINTVIDRNDRLEQVIDLINEKYVDTINSNNLYKDAIEGILKSLDPHTVYIPSDELAEVNEDLDGGFTGIGVEFSIIRDTIQITSVLKDGPAAKAGIKVGDQFIKVEDSIVAGVTINSQRISHLLRGKIKSKVNISVKSYGEGDIHTLNVTRDIIPIYSVEATILLDENTGLIKINRFSATTGKEFRDALEQLIQKGISNLIIDLRDNPGGYMNQALSVIDELMPDNKLILYTEGQHSGKTEFKSNKVGIFEKGRIAVLIDENSASASEIIAGAVQDWDRGIVAGRRSFGKGLVQQPYEMPDGSEIRLTIAKYYTPSGRCIQKSYASGKDVYNDDNVHRYENGELTGNDNYNPTDTTKFYTANKRIVFGGGGIKPDLYVPYDTLKLSSTLLNHLYSTKLKTLIWEYFLTHKDKLKYKDIQDFDKNFNDNKDIADNYLKSLSHLEKNAIQREIHKNPEIRHYFNTYIKAQIARYAYRDNGYYTIMMHEDILVDKTLKIINSDEYLKIIGGK